ncbi:hypothetical protein NIES4074_42960 [Cylindrospermum sp. NIES-4074]|nr:hypothetical protein NIES4074_42960 [Cylindrospermum sp. NIES-4074]
MRSPQPPLKRGANINHVYQALREMVLSRETLVEQWLPLKRGANINYVYQLLRERV